MTDHQLVLEHLNNQGQAILHVLNSLTNNFPAIGADTKWITDEFIRVNKEIQDEYLAAQNEAKIK
jgi:ribosome biogenesis protein Tsr3